MKNKKNVWFYIKNYKFNSMFIQSFVLIFVTFIIPFSIISRSYYIEMGNTANDEIIFENNSLIYEMRDALDVIVSESDMLCTYIAGTDNVQMFMMNDWFTDMYSGQMGDFVHLVQTLPMIYTYIDSIYVYSEYNQSVFTGEKKSPIKDLKDSGWFEEYEKIENTAGVIIPRVKNDNYPQLISLIKPIYINHEKIGAVVLNLNSTVLYKSVSTEKYKNIQNFFMLNHAGNILMSSNKKYFGLRANEIPELSDINFDGVTNSFTQKIKDINSVVSVVPSADFDFIYVNVLSMQIYQDKLNKMNMQIALLVTILFIFSIIIAFFVAVKSFKPVTEIISALENPESFNAYGDKSIKNVNELKYIISSILGQIHANKEMKNELESRLKLLDKSQLSMLQAQINPHFLYNTLETINWMAVDLTGSSNNVSKAVTVLAQLFRTNVSSGDYLIPIAQEVEQMSHYLSILELRYGDMFDVVCAIDENINRFSIIKICLQPIIENAVYHGLKPKGEKGILKITGKMQDDNIIFTVEDNGIGMDSDTVQRLRQELDSTDYHNDNHIGIYNVNQRIKIIFGQEYGLSIDSIENVGTTITVKIPQVDLVETI